MPAQTAAARAEELASACLNQLLQPAGRSQDDAWKLCDQLYRLAASEDPLAAQSAGDALFRRIVEPLGDRFEPRLCDAYVRMFSRVVDYCRRLPQGARLHEKLGTFGLKTEEDIPQRADRVRQGHRFRLETAGRLKKILVLSRVTLGADVAVTSVVLNRMKAQFGEAAVCLLGGAKAGTLFASDPRVRLIPLAYQRAGTLLERLGSWVTLTEVIASQTEGLEPEEYLIIDPDSRLTQLGLLPVTAHESSYYFFESRSFAAPPAQSLAQLTGCWLNEVFGSRHQQPQETAGSAAHDLPYVGLSEQDRALGDAVRGAVSGRLAAVNLGVGDNPAKGLGEEFETQALLAVIEAGYTVLLDRGAGDEELSRTARLTAELRQAGKSIGEVTDAAVKGAEVITWKGSLSGFAGLIAVSDLYLGYDSAGGHLAAALGVPVIDVFAGAASPRMVERWRPWGRGPVTLVAADPLVPNAVLEKVRAAIRERTR